MTLRATIDHRDYEVDLDRPVPISIPLRFDAAQPSAYGVPPAASRAYEDGTFIGDTRRGGSCNFETIVLTPHCNGTHTECVGHISDQRLPVNDLLRDALIPATLVTARPESAADTTEECVPPARPEDRLITARDLAATTARSVPAFLRALIIRTLPNDEGKRTRNYMDASPPYFTRDAIQLVASLGVTHLLVDIPSLDRMFDEGLLTAHHLFWNIPPASHDVRAPHVSERTVTELIYVPEEIPDGRYLLNLQIADFTSDAAPSRPVLFRLDELSHLE